MKAERIMVCAFDGAAALLSLVFGIEMMREYVVGYPSEEAAWVAGTAWVVMMLTAIIFFALVIAGIVLAAKGRQLRKTVIAFTTVFAVMWLFIPVSPYIAEYAYNRTGFTRIDQNDIDGILTDYGKKIEALAAENGYSLVCEDGFEWNDRGSREICTFSVGDGEEFSVEMEVAYYKAYGRMDVTAEAEFTVPADEEIALDALKDVLNCYNALALDAVTEEESLAIMSDGQYAEYAHDGYSGQLKKCGKFGYIFCREREWSDGAEQYRTIKFTYGGLSAAH